MNDIISGAYRAPTKEEEREHYLPIIKEFRQTVDRLIQRVPRSFVAPKDGWKGDELLINTFDAREAHENVRYHLISAKMWAGKILEALDNPFPEELADKAKKL